MGLKNYTPPRKKGEETTGMLSENPLWGEGILRVGAADWPTAVGVHETVALIKFCNYYAQRKI